jgi:hypothetical protein
MSRMCNLYDTTILRKHILYSLPFSFACLIRPKFEAVKQRKCRYYSARFCKFLVVFKSNLTQVIGVQCEVSFFRAFKTCFVIW